MLVMKEWRLMLNGKDVSEEADGLDAWSSFHKSALLFPRNMVGMAVASGATVVVKEKGYDIDASKADGHVTWPALHFKGAGIVGLNNDSFRVPMWESLETSDFEGEFRIWIPHGLFNQQQYLPANISLILRATLVDPTYAYLMANRFDETPLPLTPVSCQLILPCLRATPNGLQLFDRLLAENHMVMKYNLLRTETSRFVIPAGQMSATFQALCRARPMALCIHAVPLSSLDPATKIQQLHPFEMNASAASVFAPSKIFVLINGEQFPKRMGNSITRERSALGTNPAHRGTLRQDIDEYRSLCLQTLHSEYKTQPLLNLWAMTESNTAQIYFINTTSNLEKLPGSLYPVNMMGPAELNITLSSAQSEDTAIILTRFYQSTLEISPKSGHVDTNF